MNDNNDKKRGLGMGLTAFFGTGTKDDIQLKYVGQNANGQSIIVEYLPIDKVVANPDQPRKYFNKNEMDELTLSIKDFGVLQPILVTKINNDTYQIIAGERRTRASKAAGLTAIPAIVVQDANTQRLFEMALLENIQRSQLTALEEAAAYKNLIDNFNCTHESLAQSLGKSRAHISNMVRILNLPLPIIDLLSQNKISVGHAKILCGVNNAEQYYDFLQDGGVSIKALEQKIHNAAIINNVNDDEDYVPDYLRADVSVDSVPPISATNDIEKSLTTIADQIYNRQEAPRSSAVQNIEKELINAKEQAIRQPEDATQLLLVSNELEKLTGLKISVNCQNDRVNLVFGCEKMQEAEDIITALLSVINDNE
jgi:ParB family chromosome partitioning protein